MDIREDYLKYLRGDLDPYIFEKKLVDLNDQKELNEDILLDDNFLLNEELDEYL